LLLWSQLFFQGDDIIDFHNDLKDWINAGEINNTQYVKWLNKWLSYPENEYRKIGTVKSDLTPELLNKFIKRNTSCIKTQF
jgi:hypothetical protein